MHAYDVYTCRDYSDDILSATFQSLAEAKRYCDDREFKSFFTPHDLPNTWVTNSKYDPSKELFWHMEIRRK